MGYTLLSLLQEGFWGVGSRCLNCCSEIKRLKHNKHTNIIQNHTKLYDTKSYKQLNNNLHYKLIQNDPFPTLINTCIHFTYPCGWLGADMVSEFSGSYCYLDSGPRSCNDPQPWPVHPCLHLSHRIFGGIFIVLILKGWDGGCKVFYSCCFLIRYCQLAVSPCNDLPPVGMCY